MKAYAKSFRDLSFSRRTKVTTQDLPVIIKPVVDPEVVTSIDAATLEDSHVYVHCHINNDGQEMLVRIWRTTYLIDHGAESSSPLVHAENIAIAPQWSHIPGHATYSFLLIFSGLPKSCQKFDFKEDISQPGGFHVTDIPRNETDVYHIDIL